MLQESKNGLKQTEMRNLSTLRQSCITAGYTIISLSLKVRAERTQQKDNSIPTNRETDPLTLVESADVDLHPLHTTANISFW